MAPYFGMNETLNDIELLGWNDRGRFPVSYPASPKIGGRTILPTATSPMAGPVFDGARDRTRTAG